MEQQELQELAKMATRIVDHWCPAQFRHESFQVRMFRALLEANTTAMAARAKIEGKPCVRPYDACTLAPESFERLLK